MKAKVILIIVFSYVSVCLFAQVPQKFNYQAVARDASGNPLINTSISVRLSVLTTPGAVSVYSERFELATNAFGLFSVQVGTGTLVSGSFSGIDWTTGDKSLETEIDPDGQTGASPFIVMGISQLISVPYALYADRSRDGWSITGNSGTDATNFLGTTDNKALRFRLNNLPAGYIDPLKNSVYFGVQSGISENGDGVNVGIGYQALKANTGGFDNIALGYQSMTKNTNGQHNVAIGYGSLYSNKGSNNIGIGYAALYNDSLGYGNCAIGTGALQVNSGGTFNTGMGYQPLYHNSAGSLNIALGYWPLFTNTTGSRNIALGYRALLMNSLGSDNIALGTDALMASTASNNIALGFHSLQVNVGGNYNIAIGSEALNANTSGVSNIAIGYQALYSTQMVGSNVGIGLYALKNILNVTRNTAIGNSAGDGFANGAYCTFLGAATDASAANFQNSTAVGDGATITANNMVKLGDAGVTVIGGAVQWSVISDRRMKKNVENSDLGLDFILKLRPVTYEMNITTDKPGCNGHLGKVYTGFIAQEVESTLNTLGVEFSGLCKPQNETDYYSLRYGDFVVPLVKSIQQQQNTIVNQQNQLDTQREEIALLKEALAVQQKLLEKINQKILTGEQK